MDDLTGTPSGVRPGSIADHDVASLSERLQVALDAGRLGTWVWRSTTGEVQWDARLEELFGLTPGTFDGSFETYVGLLHPDDAEGVLRSVEEAMRTRSSYVVEHRVVWPDGSVHWLAGSGQVTTDEAGRPTGSIGCVGDISDRMDAERQRQRFTLEALEAAEHERVSRERLEFLGRIDDALNEARDLRHLMRSVVSAAVPRLGDWCAIYVLPDEASSIPWREIAHVDPARVARAEEVLARHPYDPGARSGIAAVIRSAETQYVPDLNEEVMARIELSRDQRQVVRELDLRSTIAIPLLRRGRVFGAMQFIMSGSSRRYTDDDVRLAHAVGSRIASSLENRRLAERQRVIASTLQASLLPEELPPIPGVEVAVRYWATGEGTEVGGDFYDLFPIGERSWGVVIGDVCGTGPSGAAVTGMARHTIASAAWHGDEPAEVLHHLNRTLRSRGTDSFCTVAFGRLDLDLDADGEPTEVRLTLANGGHPLPILAARDGVSQLGPPGTLIGVFDDISVPTTTRLLEPGDVVVLYTDGVTDVPPPFALEPEAFAAMVAEEAAPSTTADVLADRLHQRLAAILDIERRTDDIALLVLRRPLTD